MVYFVVSPIAIGSPRARTLFEADGMKAFCAKHLNCLNRKYAVRTAAVGNDILIVRQLSQVQP
jgi:hypothetical protein